MQRGRKELLHSRSLLLCLHALISVSPEAVRSSFGLDMERAGGKRADSKRNRILKTLNFKDLNSLVIPIIFLSFRAADFGGEESAFRRNAEQQIPLFVRNDKYSRTGSELNSEMARIFFLFSAFLIFFLLFHLFPSLHHLRNAPAHFRRADFPL